MLDVTIWLGTIIEPTFHGLPSWRTYLEFLGKVQFDRGWNWSRSSLGKIAEKSRRLTACEQILQASFSSPFRDLYSSGIDFNFRSPRERHYIFNLNGIRVLPAWYQVCVYEISFFYWSSRLKCLNKKKSRSRSFYKVHERYRADLNSNFN